MERPTIAIVVAVWNGASTLDACLDSFAAQSERPDEIVVMDGASVDGSRDILARRSDMLTYWESAADKGIYDAWNKALRHVTADWIWFIGCDDILSDPAIVGWWKDQLAGQPTDTGLVYSKVAMVSASGTVTEIIGRPWGALRSRQRYRMMVPHTGLLARRELFAKVGSFDPRYRIAGDYDWFMRALAHSSVAFVDQVTVNMGDAGLSGAVATQVRTITEFGAICTAHGRRRPLGWYAAYISVQIKATAARLLSPHAHSRLVDFVRIVTLRSKRGAAR